MTKANGNAKANGNPSPPRADARETNGRLINLKELPEWAQDNPYILTNYRPISASYRTCLTSLTYLHNQTVNIYSHLLYLIPFTYLIIDALMVLLEMKESKSQPHRDDTVVFGIFFAGGVACMALSASYHTFMCHSEDVANSTKQLDYTGITCLIYGSLTPTIHYTFTCEPDLMRKFLITFTCIAAVLVGFLLSPLSLKPWAAPLIAPMFVVFAGSGIAPLCKGIMLYGWYGMEQMVGIQWVLAQGAMYLLGVTAFVLQWPESRKPGRYDVFGQSHQLFHIAVVLAATLHYNGLLKAYAFQHSHAQFAICPILETWKGTVLLHPGLLGSFLRSAL